ncbi:unnamed protein product [Musa acuminata subsp. malaccensis]|uniref:CASP-like protein n=1 Tax=Musa acuminata subsp. malaccensis TaxID=214687 RepID=A0A804JUC4_MUSAM|nr:unnamed protein product [Musa acuminata subsp. malaccensis]
MLSAFGFSDYTDFCYLIASMGLQTFVFVVGDWVTATLSLAAACSSAGVTVLFVKDVNFCSKYHEFSCGRYQISTAMAFITCLLPAKTSLLMFWILASV